MNGAAVYDGSCIFRGMRDDGGCIEGEDGDRRNRTGTGESEYYQEDEGKAQEEATCAVLPSNQPPSARQSNDLSTYQNKYSIEW